MKRIMTLLAGLVMFAGCIFADTDRGIPVEKLPERARQFLNEHFSELRIAYVKQERDFLELKYEVMFSEGTKVEFDRRGRWTEVECRYNSIDSSVVPDRIRAYVEEFYPSIPFRKVSRDRNGTEVKLSSGWNCSSTGTCIS